MIESLFQWSFLPVSFPLAIRFVATSLIVLCDAPDDLIVATRQALHEHEMDFVKKGPLGGGHKGVSKPQYRAKKCRNSEYRLQCIVAQEIQHGEDETSMYGTECFSNTEV